MLTFTAKHRAQVESKYNNTKLQFCNDIKRRDEDKTIQEIQEKKKKYYACIFTTEKFIRLILRVFTITKPFWLNQ